MQGEYPLFQTDGSCFPKVWFSTKNRARETPAQCLQLRNGFHQSHGYCPLFPLVMLVGLRSYFNFNSHSQHYYFPLYNFGENISMNQTLFLAPTKVKLKKNTQWKPGLMVYVFNLSTREVEAEVKPEGSKFEASLVSVVMPRPSRAK